MDEEDYEWAILIILRIAAAIFGIFFAGLSIGFSIGYWLS